MRQAHAQRRQAVFFDGSHLAKSASMSVGQKHRIIAEAGFPARRPYQCAVNARLDFFDVTVGPGDAKRGNEMRFALRRFPRAALGQEPLDPAHRGVEIFGRSGPARRIDAGRAVKRFDDEAGIIGEGGELCGAGCGLRLDPGIGRKALAGLFGLREMKIAGRNRRDAMGREQLAHLGELAGIMGGDHELTTDTTGHASIHLSERTYATAIFCKSTSFATPFCASAISARNSSCENGVFSAVPCTSMMRPSPVMTKLASVSAEESSA